LRTRGEHVIYIIRTLKHGEVSICVQRERKRERKREIEREGRETYTLALVRREEEERKAL
jgi:hypothetical protein